MFLTVVYKLESGRPVNESEIVSFVLTDTKPEFSDLHIAKSSLHPRHELSSDAQVGSSQLALAKAARRN